MVAFFVPPNVIGASVASLVFQATTQQTSSTNYTFSSQAIGQATASRYVIVAAHLYSNSARTISSLTVGGISATQVITQSVTNFFAYRASIYIVAVPTGTTADIVVNTSGVCELMTISVWAAYDLNSATAVDSDSATSTGSTTFSIPSMSTSADGFAVASCVYNRNGTGSAFAWTNATERSDTVLNIGGVYTGASGADASTTGSGLAISTVVSGSSSVDAGIALAASFR